MEPLLLYLWLPHLWHLQHLQLRVLLLHPANQHSTRGTCVQRVFQWSVVKYTSITRANSCKSTSGNFKLSGFAGDPDKTMGPFALKDTVSLPPRYLLSKAQKHKTFYEKWHFHKRSETRACKAPGPLIFVKVQPGPFVCCFFENHTPCLSNPIGFMNDSYLSIAIAGSRCVVNKYR